MWSANLMRSAKVRELRQGVPESLLGAVRQSGEKMPQEYPLFVHWDLLSGVGLVTHLSGGSGGFCFGHQLFELALDVGIFAQHL